MAADNYFGQKENGIPTQKAANVRTIAVTPTAKKDFRTATMFLL
jgi:hypothetical protein